MKPSFLINFVIFFWGCQRKEEINAELAINPGGKPLGDMSKAPWLCQLGGGCGCTIISPDYLITAMHCLKPGQSSYSVYYGTLERASTHKATTRVVRSEPRFNKLKNDHDLAVLKFNKALTFDKNTAAAKLPDSIEDCKVGKSVTVVGRGASANRGKGSRSVPEPNYLSGKIIPCTKQSFTGSICTGPMPCNGDSGGPLVSELGPNAVVYGAVSHSARFGTPCRTEVRYGSVCHHLDILRKYVPKDPNSSTTAPPTSSGNAPPTSPPNTPTSTPGGSGGSNNAPPPSSGGQSGGSTIWGVSPWIFVTLIALLLVFLCALILCWIFRIKAEKKRALKNKKGRARKKKAVQR